MAQHAADQARGTIAERYLGFVAHGHPDPHRVTAILGDHAAAPRRGRGQPGVRIDSAWTRSGSLASTAGVGFRQHAMAQVEHVPLGRATAGEHVPGSLLDDFPRREQDSRIEVALQCLSRLHPPDGLVEGDAPIDANHVRARLGHEPEQLTRSDSEMDAGTPARPLSTFRLAGSTIGCSRPG